MRDLDLSRTWIIADTHFGHENIKVFCHRPEDHDELMVDYWRRCVPDSDSTVLHLGDIAMRGGGKFLSHIAPRLTGEHKLLMLGNHDTKPNSYYESAGFKIIEPFEITWHGNRISFSHYPWNSRDDGSDAPPLEHWRVHGHIHNNGYGPPPVWPHVQYVLRQINVSAEMLKYRPINLKVLLEAAILGELP